MARGACCGIDHIKFQQPWVHKTSNVVQMADRCDTSDGKACLSPDQSRIGFGQCLASHMGRLVWRHLIATRCEKEDRLAAGRALKDD